MKTRKRTNKIKEFIVGTSCLTLPIITCLIYGLICNLLGL